MKYLLDTNVFREIGKANPQVNVAAWLDGVDDSDLAISAVTVREVRKGIVRLGIRKPKIAEEIKKRVTEVLTAFGNRILPITRDIAQLRVQLLGENEKHVDDMALAATARVHDLILITRNVKHFSERQVPTLDPYKAKTERKA